ncbi:M15 family metallopeptidase [Mycolicibacterium sp. Dal123E01]|uniref:M15 family metallopeptidase n=1 Tax=Mycolicibacterium sp. Dal123E01 TaxID=3457578 RepID=UPI00403EBD5D
MLAATVLVQCAPPPASAPTSVIPSTTTVVPGPLVRPVTAAELGATWRPGCPVAPEQLRRVDLDYIGFDGRTHRGTLVVHQDLVADVIAIFGDLQRQGYPIAKMQTPEHYPNAADELSMEDNNTSAFNCRPLPGSADWSLHAYGRAIDINPLLNPYIEPTGHLEPATAGPYLDRARTDPGILHTGDPGVLAFTDRGWIWGGNWHNPIDYQHFEHR